MILKKEVEFAKEIDDVAVLLIGLVKDIRTGKPAGEIAVGNIQRLIDAVAGIDQLGDELKGSRVVALQTLGYRTGELTDAILGQ